MAHVAQETARNVDLLSELADGQTSEQLDVLVADPHLLQRRHVPAQCGFEFTLPLPLPPGHLAQRGGDEGLVTEQAQRSRGVDAHPVVVVGQQCLECVRVRRPAHV